MEAAIKVNEATLKVEKADVTDIEVEAFVFYARPDLKLFAGFGNAIALRGGLSIQKELEEYEEQALGSVVVTAAGKMKAEKILHAVGPRFMEEDSENKLKMTIANVFKTAAEKGITQFAMPPMGAGFYAVPLEESALITLEAVKENLAAHNTIKEVVVCANDNYEFRALSATLEKLA